MTDADYIDALRLLERATDLLRQRDQSTQAELAYELRRLRIAFDTLRVQIGQVPPELLRN